MIGILCGVKEMPDTDQAYGYLLERDCFAYRFLFCLFVWPIGILACTFVDGIACLCRLFILLMATVLHTVSSCMTAAMLGLGLLSLVVLYLLASRFLASYIHGRITYKSGGLSHTRRGFIQC